jgi:hypothetical protein
MSAEVDIAGTLAIVEGGQWSCDNPTILRYLAARALYLGNSPSIPDLDEHLAVDAGAIGAQILKHSEPASDSPKGVIH